MFNRTGITKITGAAPVQILFDVEHQMSVPVMVNKSVASYVTENGRKIVKAGTPLTGNLEARGTAFTAATTTSGVSNAVGILLHDVDITEVNANATLLIWGFVNLDRIDSTTAALLTTEAKTALAGKVWFLKD